MSAFRFIIAAEDHAGAALATGLADRVLLEIAPLVDGLAWIDADALPDARTWTGVDGNGRLTLSQVKRIAAERKIRIQGKFGDEPSDTMLHRKVLRIVGAEPPALLVVAQDDDGCDRRRGFRRAVEREQPAFPAVYAGMVPEAEGWPIAAFTPVENAERARLESACGLLGFDPTRRPQQLTSTTNGDRDAKTTARRLYGDADPIDHCVSCDLAALRRTAEESGLPAYLVDVEAELRRLGGG